MSERMRIEGWLDRWLIVAMLVGGSTGVALAHCDTMTGPVITAARNALESRNVNLVLIWVQPEDEALIRDEFGRALAAHLTGGEAQEVAEHHFFELLVQTHRAGEGAAYTGIKPAGTDVSPAVTAADQALEVGSVEPVRAALVEAVGSAIDRHFRVVMDLKNYSADDVAAGRAFVKAYVAYMHYAEGLYDTATSTDVDHAHEGDAHGAAHPVHEPAGSGEVE
jgi:hypothetical protein